MMAAGRADAGRDDALSALPSPAPSSPFLTQELHALQQLQLRNRNSPHQTSFPQTQQLHYSQPSIRIHPSAPVNSAQQGLSSPSFQQTLPQQQQQQIPLDDTYAHWQQQPQQQSQQSVWQQSIASNPPLPNTSNPWDDSNLWELSNDSQFGLSPVQVPTYHLPQQQQQQTQAQQQQQQQQQKRASSTSSYASFGPHTPPSSSNQIATSVEDFDSEGLPFSIADGFSQGLTQELLRDFDKFCSNPQNLDIPVEPSSRPQPTRFSRDAQQIWQNQRRLAQQRIMSQDSQGTNGMMGPPTLPRTESTDTDGGFKSSGEPAVPKLDRTLSDAYQDTLFHSSTNDGFSPISRPKPSSQESVSRDMMEERLAEAHDSHIKARSRSPTEYLARKRSPFKPNAPESPHRDQFLARSDGNVPAYQTAAQMREWQKAQQDQATAAKHSASSIKQDLDAPIKTVSPKEVALDYQEDPETDNMPSLFAQEEPPSKRQRKDEQTTVSRLKPGVTRENTRMSDASDQSFASMATSRRESSQSTNGGGSRSTHSYPFFQRAARRQASTASINAATDSQSSIEPVSQTPALESNRSSDLDQGLRKRGYSATNSPSTPKARAPLVKQDSIEEDEDYTYTCTYHGCTRRFDSQSSLQRHKREVHHSTAHHSRNSISGTSTAVSPGAQSPTGAQFTSANAGQQQPPAVAQRASPSGDSDSATPPGSSAAANSQAGPHICTRTNPTTGKPCNSQFSRPYDLTRHEDTIHNSRKEKVKCALCKDEKTFSRSDALTRHMRVVHGQKDGPSGRGRGRA